MGNELSNPIKEMTQAISHRFRENMAVKTESGVRVMVDSSVIAKEMPEGIIKMLEKDRVKGQRMTFPVKAEDLKGKRFVKSSEVKAEQVYPTNNGLLSAVMLAYNNHFPLKLRPDDLWMSVIMSLGQYIDKNAEKVRYDFVNHEKQKDLIIEVPGSWASDDNLIDWPYVIGMMTKLIQENTLNEVSQAIQANYSTSDDVSIIASRVTLMSSLKSFFIYGMCTRCGIREVYLDGTLEDWVKLRADVAHLGTLSSKAEPDLRDWLTNLDNILSKFIDNYKGYPDSDFWSHIYSQTKYASGDNFASGWILNFFLYEGSGDMMLILNPTIRLDYLPAMYSVVPFLFLENDSVRKFTMVSGSWGVEVTKNYVSPIIQWMITE